MYIDFLVWCFNSNQYNFIATIVLKIVISSLLQDRYAIYYVYVIFDAHAQ